MKELVDTHYPKAQKITLVMDNLNTHRMSCLYEAFPPAEARRLIEKIEVIHTPQAWQLAEHRRMRTERAGEAMPSANGWATRRTYGSVCRSGNADRNNRSKKDRLAVRKLPTQESSFAGLLSANSDGMNH